MIPGKDLKDYLEVRVGEMEGALRDRANWEGKSLDQSRIDDERPKVDTTQRVIFLWHANISLERL